MAVLHVQVQLKLAHATSRRAQLIVLPPSGPTGGIALCPAATEAHRPALAALPLRLTMVAKHAGFSNLLALALRVLAPSTAKFRSGLNGLLAASLAQEALTLVLVQSLHMPLSVGMFAQHLLPLGLAMKASAPLTVWFLPTPAGLLAPRLVVSVYRSVLAMLPLLSITEAKLALHWNRPANATPILARLIVLLASSALGLLALFHAAPDLLNASGVMSRLRMAARRAPTPLKPKAATLSPVPQTALHQLGVFGKLARRAVVSVFKAAIARLNLKPATVEWGALI